MSGDDQWKSVSRYLLPHESPGFILWSRFMRWQRELNAELRPLGLTQPQFALLAVCGWLSRKGHELTQQQVVEFLDLDRMHVSQILSRLESAGLVERHTSTSDTRSKAVTLTDLGRKRLTQSMSVVEAFDQRFFDAP